ncbi:MAG TPA: hypothetical protein VJB14_14180, partial [Planctomycetota bacterium]|nr:hypothetical protein [Planctomycetota bacterium]
MTCILALVLALQDRVDPTGDPLPKGAVARLGTLRLRHEDAVVAVAFSPDGKQVASASHDRSLRTWDAATGKRLLTVEGHRGRMYGLAWAPDGKRIATAGHDKTIRIWDAATGFEVNSYYGHEEHVWAVAFSPDGKLVASAGADTVVHLWDAGT